MRPTGEPAFEMCALAGGAVAERLAARLVERSADERESIVLDALSPEDVGDETPEAARRWVANVIARQGWTELERP